MASDLLSIARSGAQAARVALDVTAQNIANASSEGYVRRSVRLEEVASSGGVGRAGDVSLSGVRLDRVVRNADHFRQAEVRRTSGDAARADAEVAGLQNVESALEQTSVHPAIVQFEATLQQLLTDPTEPGLRAAVVEDTRTLARTFNIASSSLDAAGEGIRFQASDSVAKINLFAGELARVNINLTRAADASSDQTALLDQRDLLLQQISEHIDIATTIAADETVEVRLGGASGPQLVSGGAANGFVMTTAADGTVSFALAGTAVAPLSGSLTGRSQALLKLAEGKSELDAIALSIIATVNAAQTGGVALDGSPGQPMLSGTGAGDMALAFDDVALIATAPAGAGANSRDPGNLDALRILLAAADPAARMDALLFDISSTVSSRGVTREALDAIAGNALVALQAQAGVDLDNEAISLLRFQQAFQANGRVIQVASDIFDTLLGIR